MKSIPKTNISFKFYHLPTSTVLDRKSRLFIIFLNGHLSEVLWLIPSILKWQERKIFTKLVPLQTPSRSSHRRCSLKKGALKNLWKFTGKHLGWSLFLTKLQTFRPQVFSCEICKVCKSIHFEEHLGTTASDKT